MNYYNILNELKRSAESERVFWTDIWQGADRADFKSGDWHGGVLDWRKAGERWARNGNYIAYKQDAKELLDKWQGVELSEHIYGDYWEAYCEIVGAVIEWGVVGGLKPPKAVKMNI